MLFNRISFQVNPNKFRILVFLVPVFFFYLNENVISLTYPIVGELLLNSAFYIGIIISLTSIIGILCDFFFPQIFKASDWKQQFIMGMILAIFLNITLSNSVHSGSVPLLILAGLLWTLYYEFCAFAINNYLAVSEKSNNFVYDWSLISIVYNVAAIIGPILASFIIEDFFLVLLVFQLISLISIFVVGYITRKEIKVTPKSKIKSTLSLFRGLEIWKVLVPKVLPLILFSIGIGIIDSTYWTIGGLYASQIFKNNDLSWITIVMYSIPFIFGSIIMAKLNMKKFKKLTSQIFLAINAVLLLIFFIPDINPFIAMGIILVSSFFLALASPLNDAAFSDLLTRLNEKMEHLVGIKKISYSIAYIIGPVLSGFLTENFGFQNTFAIMGLGLLILAVTLLSITPKKIRLPQTELSEIK